MAFVTPADVTQISGIPLAATSRPTEAAVQGMIDRARKEIEGALRARGVKIPVDETLSPDAFNIIFDQTLYYIAAQVQRAHHAVLNDIPPTLLKDIRERVEAWRNWIEHIQSDKGSLPDTEKLDSYEETAANNDVLASVGSGPVFRVTDEF